MGLYKCHSSLTSTCFHFKASSRRVLADEPHSTSDPSSRHASNPLHMGNHVLSCTVPCHPPTGLYLLVKQTTRSFNLCSAQGPPPSRTDTLPRTNSHLLLLLTFRWAWSLTRWKESSSSFFSRSKSTWACLATDTCLVTSAFCKRSTVSRTSVSPAQRPSSFRKKRRHSDRGCPRVGHRHHFPT